MNLKELNAPNTTITFNRQQIESKVGNIYEAIVIIGKRAEQINTIIKNDLNQKLDERLPKPTLIAIQEWLDNEVYFRKTDAQ